VAKRLMDYGFTPDRVVPGAGTLMVEPTESEPKDELTGSATMIAIPTRGSRHAAPRHVLKNAAAHRAAVSSGE